MDTCTYTVWMVEQYHIGAGSIPEKCGDKIYNTSMSFGPDGALLGTFRKV